MTQEILFENYVIPAGAISLDTFEDSNGSSQNLENTATGILTDTDTELQGVLGGSREFISNNTVNSFPGFFKSQMLLSTTNKELSFSIDSGVEGIYTVKWSDLSLDLSSTSGIDIPFRAVDGSVTLTLTDNNDNEGVAEVANITTPRLVRVLLDSDFVFDAGFDLANIVSISFTGVGEIVLRFLP